MFETPDMGPGISPFFVSVCFERFETIESVDLEIFACSFVSVALLYNLYVSMFRNTRYGGWNFHLFFVSVCFETFRNNGKWDLEIFCCSLCFSSFTI